jgi:hypothetical protein
MTPNNAGSDLDDVLASTFGQEEGRGKLYPGKKKIDWFRFGRELANNRLYIFA